MKNYELIAMLSELPAGAEVMCSGCETIDNFTSSEPLGKDDMGNNEYPISRDIKDVDLEGNRIYLQW